MLSVQLMGFTYQKYMVAWTFLFWKNHQHQSHGRLQPSSVLMMDFISLGFKLISMIWRVRYARARMNPKDSFLKSKDDVLLLERFHLHFTIMEKQWAGWWLKWWVLVRQEGNPRTEIHVRCSYFSQWIHDKECTGWVWLISFKKVSGLTIMAMKLTWQSCQLPLITPVVHSTV